ncbi:hypothetical protein ACP6EK_08395 [Candidatus Caldatribacterium sp. SIUC1]|uniref:hypothetical protein n=1 Tax=Candidatus Caldatribacterium sp. SIUC1 TaxID=3418365 RepID=UPI003F68D3F9
MSRSSTRGNAIISPGGRTIPVPKGRLFRLYIEEHYPFGEFALIRVRGDAAEVGFVLADEDMAKYVHLKEQALEIAHHLQRRLKEEGLNHIALPSVGKDLDFITVSLIVDLSGFREEEIGEIADRIMQLLGEVNPYRERGNEDE